MTENLAKQPNLLPQAPEVLYLFGLPGAGKTYIGDLIARESTYHHYNADDDFTPTMLKAIDRREEFSDEMRDEFYELISKKLPRLVEQYKNVIVSQATFRRQHRDMIRHALDDLEFVWVQAPQSVIIQRLRARGNEVTSEYFKKVAPNFEAPEKDCKSIVNDKDDTHIIDTFRHWYN